MLTKYYFLQTFTKCVIRRGLSSSAPPKVGIVGMGHVGDAVCKNLLRKGYTVAAINDIALDRCKGYPENIQIKRSAREVAEVVDIVVSGKYASII